MDALEVNGHRIAYDSAGDGKPVVLIGGSGMPSATWDFSFRPALVSAGHRVVTVDCRGVGESEAPPPPYSIRDIADDIATVIRELQLGPCAAIGLSAGGFVAEQLAVEHGELLRTLVLIASGGSTTAYMRAKVKAEQELIATVGSLPAAYEQIDALTVTLPARILQDDDAAVTTWQELLSGGIQYADPQAALGWGQAMRDWLLDESRPERWERITRPCLVVAFEHDLQFPPSRCRAMADALPAGTFRQIDGVAHGNGAFEAADQLGEAITDFLSGSMSA